VECGVWSVQCGVWSVEPSSRLLAGTRGDQCSGNGNRHVSVSTSANTGS
jgi:hypothetical protein